MSWRDRFTAIGSFRGAKFVMRSADKAFGRRVQIHEFPGRDDISAEDLGLRKKEHNIEVFVAGDDYQSERDKLVDAINQPGAGALTHPYKGSLNVTITDARMRESTREGGMAIFTLSYVITPPEPVLENVDTAALVQAATDKSLVESINDFAEVFDVIGQADVFVQEIIDDIDNTLGAVENVVTGVTNDIVALIRAPFDMAVAVVGSFNKIKRTLQRVLNVTDIYSSDNTDLTSSTASALNISQAANANVAQTNNDLAVASYDVYTGLFAAGDDATPVPTTTPNRQKQSDNITAVHRLVQQAAVSSACLMSASMQYDSLDDAVAVRDVLLDAIDDQINQSMSDELYSAFTDMRAAVVTDLRERGMQLPRLAGHTPLATSPALVIAHQLYGDATREAEIVARNKIIHPGFIPAGESLEVLTDAA